MIVPRYWAEGRVRHREAGKQITVRRFGWSDISEAEAQVTADARAAEALQRLLSGEKLPRREPKLSYNGADGVPIREEILECRGETIMTRNSYGARCLNTPNVFFADIDFAREANARVTFVVFIVLLLLSAAVGWLTHSRGLGIALSVCSLIGAFPVANALHRKMLKSAGGPEQIARDRIKRFISANPAWNLMIYRTPAGIRTLATHQLFQPGEPEVARCFDALGTDPIYRKMCLKQQCFRARVSPKPWRIGIGDHLRPRPGTWPVKEEYLPVRSAWLARYEAAAGSFASCSFIESLGSGAMHPEVIPVQRWHDELSRATSQLPIA